MGREERLHEAAGAGDRAIDLDDGADGAVAHIRDRRLGSLCRLGRRLRGVLHGAQDVLSGTAEAVDVATHRANQLQDNEDKDADKDPDDDGFDRQDDDGNVSDDLQPDRLHGAPYPQSL